MRVQTTEEPWAAQGGMKRPVGWRALSGRRAWAGRAMQTGLKPPPKTYKRQQKVIGEDEGVELRDTQKRKKRMWLGVGR